MTLAEALRHGAAYCQIGEFVYEAQRNVDGSIVVVRNPGRADTHTTVWPPTSSAELVAEAYGRSTSWHELLLFS